MSTSLASSSSSRPVGVNALARRLCANRKAVFGLGVLALVILGAVFAPLLAPYDALHMGEAFAGPSALHYFGTDNLGEDTFSNILFGARTSLLVGVCAVLTSAAIGITVGALAGYFGGRLDNIFMRVTEMFQILPQFFLAIVVVALFGSSIWIVVLVIGLLSWPVTARLLRAEFLSLRKREFVEAARGLGMSDRDIIFREILPNALPPVIVSCTLQISSAILLETSLAFLGLGDPNVMSWGTMLHNAQDYFGRAWWMAAFPGIALFITTLSLNLVGDAVNDALNPKA